MMTSLRSTLAAAAACGLLFSAAAPAFAAPKDYQITGNVAAMTDTTLTITTLKKDTWEIGRDSTSKLPDGLKPGDRVTVHYTMLAGTVDMNAGGAKDKKAAATGTKAAKKGKADAAATTTEPAASGSPSKPAAEAASPTP